MMPRDDELMLPTWWISPHLRKNITINVFNMRAEWKTSQKEHRRCTQGHMTRTAKKIKYEWVQICHYYPSQRKPITFVYDLTIQRGAKQMASRVFPAFKTEFAGGHIALQGWGGGCWRGGWRAITAKHSTAMHSFGQTLFKWDEILLICEGRQMR